MEKTLSTAKYIEPKFAGNFRHVMTIKVKGLSLRLRAYDG